MNNRDDIRHISVGVIGTLAAISVEKWSAIFAMLAGGFTTGYMGIKFISLFIRKMRELYQFFRERKRKRRRHTNKQPKDETTIV